MLGQSGSALGEVPEYNVRRSSSATNCGMLTRQGSQANAIINQLSNAMPIRTATRINSVRAVIATTAPALGSPDTIQHRVR